MIQIWILRLNSLINDFTTLPDHNHTLRAMSSQIFIRVQLSSYEKSGTRRIPCDRGGLTVREIRDAITRQFGLCERVEAPVNGVCMAEKIHIHLKLGDDIGEPQRDSTVVQPFATVHVRRFYGRMELDAGEWKCKKLPPLTGATPIPSPQPHPEEEMMLSRMLVWQAHASFVYAVHCQHAWMMSHET